MHGEKEVYRPYSNPLFYTISLNAEDRQCIASTLRPGNPRCRSSIKDAADVALIAELLEQITSSSDAKVILASVHQLILSRCCVFGSHRVKLQAESKCRNDLAELYIQKLKAASLLRVDVSVLNSTLEEIDPAGVILYETEVDLLLEVVLRSDIDLEPKVKGEKRLPKLGVVYVLTLPSHQGLVKIGYSGNSAEERCVEWGKCFPGASVLAEKQVPYPERMEQLIHLQLREHRRQIAKCSVCSKGHIELFEMPAAAVLEVLSDWDLLVSKQPLYDDCQILTASWSAILIDLEIQLTARVLLDLLEAAAKREHEQTKSQHHAAGETTSRNAISPTADKLVVLPILTKVKTTTSSDAKDGAATVSVQVVLPALTPAKPEVKTETVTVKREDANEPTTAYLLSATPHRTTRASSSASLMLPQGGSQVDRLRSSQEETNTNNQLVQTPRSCSGVSVRSLARRFENVGLVDTVLITASTILKPNVRSCSRPG